MAKNKGDINKNFENLKAQMMKKKELAESTHNNENKIEDLSIYTHRNINKGISNIEKHENNKENINFNENNHINNNSENDNIELYIDDEIEDINVGTTEYIAKKTGVVSDININKIIIKKVEKQEPPKRITYYLRPDTIKKIDKFSRLSGMGKSEFVQKILDEVLNNLEIEK